MKLCGRAQLSIFAGRIFQKRREIGDARERIALKQSEASAQSTGNGISDVVIEKKERIA